MPMPSTRYQVPLRPDGLLPGSALRSLFWHREMMNMTLREAMRYSNYDAKAVRKSSRRAAQSGITFARIQHLTNEQIERWVYGEDK